ncbi:MAG: hypothetical protein AABY22_01690 [Nanoarchaeota archaeon]
MNFYYCQSCFKKTPQTTSVITKCAHCGKGSEINTINNNVRQTTPPIGSNEYRQQLINRSERQNRIRAEVEIETSNHDEDIEDLEGDFDNVNDENVSVPNIDKLKVEVDIPKSSGMSVRSLAKGAQRKTKTKTKGKKIDKQQFLADFQKSASTLRKNK